MNRHQIYHGQQFKTRTEAIFAALADVAPENGEVVVHHSRCAIEWDDDFVTVPCDCTPQRIKPGEG